MMMLCRGFESSMPSTPQEVINTFLSLWNELRTHYAESLVFSMHSRMDKIIQTNGFRHLKVQLVLVSRTF